MQWIALEVHDRIAQTLASAFQQLQMLESMTRSEPRAWQTAVRASGLLREAMREARNIMNELYPPILDEYGVGALMEEELRHFQEDTGCQARFVARSRPRLGQVIEAALYRIFHEALINIHRHAKATEVQVSMDNEESAVRLEVRDNGVGFDVEESRSKRRVGGLMSMQRRATLLGGVCLIESGPGKGTRIRVRIPLTGH